MHELDYQGDDNTEDEMTGDLGADRWSYGSDRRHTDASQERQVLRSDFLASVTRGRRLIRPDDDRGAGAAVRNPGSNLTGVGNVAHREDAGQVDTRQPRPDRAAPGDRTNTSYRFVRPAAGVEAVHADRARRRIDADNVGVDADGDVEAILEPFGRRDQQRSLVSDHVTDEVRQSAVGEGDIGSAIEDDDLHGLVEPPEPRGARRASRHAPTINMQRAPSDGGGFFSAAAATSVIGTPVRERPALGHYFRR